MKESKRGARLLHGDALAILQTLPAESVNCCITSPPYWGLRDYGSDGQIGMEPTPDEYITKLVAVFREVRRVLRDDGTLWVNIVASYSSGIIESDDAIIRKDITDDEYAEAVSALFFAHEQAERDVSPVLFCDGLKAGELRDASMRQVRSGLQDSQITTSARAGEVLLAELRPVGEPGKEEGEANGFVSDVRDAIREVRRRDEEDETRKAFLQCDVLVQFQPEGQSLPLGRRAARQDEPGRDQVAEGCPGSGQVSLSDMPCEPEVGSAPHSTIRHASRSAVGGVERRDAMQGLPSEVSPSRDGILRDPCLHRISASCRLEIALPKSGIPQRVSHLFRPKWTLKPKDLVNTPAMLAEALRADGWWLRQDIIWHKPNPMPESIKDRCTKAHEYIFLLSKSPRYWYDADAVAEPALNTPGGRLQRQARRSLGEVVPGAACNCAPGSSASGCGLESARALSDSRNRRSVWTLVTLPTLDAHFATFPIELPEICLRAGCPEGGTVIDPFNGAGTTGLACLKNGRNYIGIDLNEKYLEIARRRMDRHYSLFSEPDL